MGAVLGAANPWAAAKLPPHALRILEGRGPSNSCGYAMAGGQHMGAAHSMDCAPWAATGPRAAATTWAAIAQSSAATPWAAANPWTAAAPWAAGCQLMEVRENMGPKPQHSAGTGPSKLGSGIWTNIGAPGAIQCGGTEY